MQSTYLLIGKDGPRSNLGTGFIVVKPLVDDHSHGVGILITAAHVLAEMPTDSIAIIGHERTDKGWAAVPINVKIREGKDHRPLWWRHPHEDVAALPLPRSPSMNRGLPATLLLEAGSFGGTGLRTGDELRVLGFPLGRDSEPPGFALLRSGRVSSYLGGTSQASTFLLDFPVFPGNSGGPVFLDQIGRGVNGGVALGHFQGIAGLVDKELVGTEQETGPYGVSTQPRPIGIAVVIRSSVIRELLEQMP